MGTPLNTEAQESAAIVTRILQGDLNAEAKMISRYARGLFFILQRKCGNKELAEDISQETWRIAIEKIRKGELREVSKISAFIIQIGKNLVIMHFRKSETRKTCNNIDNQIFDIPNAHSGECSYYHNPEEKLLTHTLGLTVNRVIREMGTPRDRELMTRYFIREQAKHDICDALDLKSNHFDRVIYRAKLRFKSIWLEDQKIS